MAKIRAKGKKAAKKAARKPLARSHVKKPTAKQLAKLRSEAALRGAETRRRNAELARKEAEKRSRAAKKAAKTRARNRREAERARRVAEEAALLRAAELRQKRSDAAKAAWKRRKEAAEKAREARERAEATKREKAEKEAAEKARRSEAARKGWERRKAKKKVVGAVPSRALIDLFENGSSWTGSWQVFADGQQEGLLQVGPGEEAHDTLIWLEGETIDALVWEPVWMQVGVLSNPPDEASSKYDKFAGLNVVFTFPRMAQFAADVFLTGRTMLAGLEDAGFETAGLLLRVHFGKRPARYGIDE